MSKAKSKGTTKKSFEMLLDNPRILKTVIDTLSSHIDETKIQISKEGMHIKAMDPSRIAIVMFELPKESFEDFNCSRAIEIGINLDDFNKILKRSTPNEQLKLEYNVADQKLHIQFKTVETSRTRSFTLTSLDLDIEEIPMKNLMTIEYPSQWKMSPAFLIEALKDAEIYAEIINMQCNPVEGLKFSASGQIGEMNYYLEIDDLFETDITEKQTSAYSLTFLKPIMALSAITESFTTYLKEDHPLRLDFELIEGGKIVYFLAPRVEEAEFDEEMDEGYETPEDTEQEEEEGEEEGQEEQEE